MADLLQMVSVFASGAAGCLSMAKLLQTLERRRNAAAHAEDSEDESPADISKGIRELFPNGEKAQILRAIRDLRRENECRRDENAELKSDLSKIAAHLKIPV